MIGVLSKVLHSRVKDLIDLKKRRDAGETVFTHVPTGLKSFDARFGGLEVGILTLVVGHTGDGKTSVLGQLAKGAASAGFGVLLVLLEDPLARIADRYLAGVMGESANKISRLNFGTGERLEAALTELDWAKRVGVVAGMYSPDDVLDLVNRTTDVGGAPLGLVIVDYAQGFSDAAENMEKVCAQMARNLNGVAGERKLACVFGSQVATDVLHRGRTRWERTLALQRPDEGGFRPGKGDVMWARRLEQYSKAVWYIFRPGRWRRELGDEGATDDTMEITVGKANYGAEGCETFAWHGPSTSISDRVAA